MEFVIIAACYRFLVGTVPAAVLFSAHVASGHRVLLLAPFVHPTGLLRLTVRSGRFVLGSLRLRASYVIFR